MLKRNDCAALEPREIATSVPPFAAFCSVERKIPHPSWQSILQVIHERVEQPSGIARRGPRTSVPLFQAAAFLWHTMHFFEVGAVVSGFFFATSS